MGKFTVVFSKAITDSGSSLNGMRIDSESIQFLSRESANSWISGIRLNCKTWEFAKGRFGEAVMVYPPNLNKNDAIDDFKTWINM